jgi:predicted kinase
MKIIALAGPPGAGKTHYKDHTQAISHLPFFDVAAVYDEFPGIAPADAFSEVLNRITQFASKDNAHQDIVVEAMFARESINRQWLSYIGEANGYTVEYIEFETPLKTCMERVEAQWNRSSQSLADRLYYGNRTRILKYLIDDEEEHESNKRSKLARAQISSAS